MPSIQKRISLCVSLISILGATSCAVTDGKGYDDTPVQSETMVKKLEGIEYEPVTRLSLVQAEHSEEIEVIYTHEASKYNAVKPASGEKLTPKDS